MSDKQNFHDDRDGNGLELLDLDSSWFDKVVTLQRTVIEDLMDHSMFYPLMPGEIERLLDGQGMSVGMVDSKGELVGYSAAYFPGKTQHNLGLDLGIAEEQLDQVVHLEVSMVDPDHRSMGLQKMMYQYLLEQIKVLAKYRYVSSTVSPWNLSSLAGTLSLSLLIACLKPKYYGYWRYIFYQDLLEPVTIDPGQIEITGLNDIDRQQQLLDQGHYGFEMRVEPAKVEVRWGRPT
ncbi:MAG: N-acetyltransferase family protein [Acidobacteriota bacterium]